ncbi:MAG: transglycosylase family protein [Thermoleophilaceae bacterium]
MRKKLFPIPVLACLVAVSTALADEPGLPATGGELIAAPLYSDPLDAIEARARARAARRSLARAARDARPEPAEPVTPAVPPHLEAIASCESGGDPGAVSASGAYRGKYQFSPATWAAVGGSGDPAAAPEGEQDRRAAILYEQSGPGQWPVCGG